ncbi:RNA-binding protein [Peribacillus saganii]|uniref:RNA-binding protein n=1 Tax=Peribacillus saganii TaxID=2303992 RepID=A0A372LPN7_9BACI|nr:KOW domain-containing RNA-binding protein [Peribacillus saganii]RFU68606.1 RNA-binding protein [Peribacillus saganii]
MKDEKTSLRIGQFVLITQGRDTGNYAVVIRLLDERFVLIADGMKHRFHDPKRKNIHHLRFLDCISTEVRNSIVESGYVTNGKLRFAVSKFVNEHVAKEKGE